MRYGIIPAAGFGTRFLPWSKAVPKELIPVGDRPVLHHVVAEAMAAGLTEIVIVISRGKEAICQYFERDEELERSLANSGKSALLEPLRSIQQRVRFHYVYQESMRGLGDAVRCGAAAVDGEPFAVLLGDTIIAGQSPLAAMIADFNDSGISSVAVQAVPPTRANRYGVCGGHEATAGIFLLDTMVEKPALDAIPMMRMRDATRQPMAFAARYVFSHAIVRSLQRTSPGLNGEIQLTDAMRDLLVREGFHAHLLQGHRLDVGNPQGLREAFELLPQL